VSVYVVGVLLLLRHLGRSWRYAVVTDSLQPISGRHGTIYTQLQLCNDMYSGTICYYVLKLQNNL
jgi:hypothetical protein